MLHSVLCAIQTGCLQQNIKNYLHCYLCSEYLIFCMIPGYSWKSIEIFEDTTDFVPENYNTPVLKTATSKSHTSFPASFLAESGNSWVNPPFKSHSHLNTHPPWQQ